MRVLEDVSLFCLHASKSSPTDGVAGEWLVLFSEGLGGLYVHVGMKMSSMRQC